VDRLIYVAMSGGKQIMQAQALVANNLANVSTQGFRADLARFQPAAVDGPGFQSRVNVTAQGLGFDHQSGTMIHTARELDVAVDGTGWIAVQASDGQEAYTRDGALRLSPLGLLETAHGELVLGDNGPVSVPPHTQLSVGQDGTISIVPQGQGPETIAQIGRIKLVNLDRASLVKRPDGLIHSADGIPAEADANVRLLSGFVEASNVNAAQTLVSMIELARQFEIEVRMMQIADENESQATSLAQLT
jgi:flagellar basal-body rod protein FlgF